MGAFVWAVLVVLVTIFLVPIPIYGLVQALFGLALPGEASPARFLLGVFVSKVGTAVTFVGLFYLGRTVFSESWLLYASLWLLMFAVDEFGQVISKNGSWKEAAAGFLSELIYFPAAAFFVTVIFR